MLDSPEIGGLRETITDLIAAAERLKVAAGQIASQCAYRASASESLGAESEAQVSNFAAPELSADQRLVCERVINAFETGSAQGNYASITIYPDGPHDIRQITYGRAQTTEYGNLRELIQMYIDAGGLFSHELSNYVDDIGGTALVDNAVFKSLLRRAGSQDPIMRETQDRFFERCYFQPALRWAGNNGFTRALSVLVIYDSYIHSGSIRDSLRSRFPELVPSQGGNEETWIQQYVDVRHSWLKTHHRPAVRASAYRTRDLAREIARGNWDLAQLPISANGVMVDARTVSVAGADQQATGVPYYRKNPPYEDVTSDVTDASLLSSAPSDDDPAAPGPGETNDLPEEAELTNFGIRGEMDVADIVGAAAHGALLTLDVAKANAFLQACMTSVPRVTYFLGKKVPFFGAVPGQDFTQVDCSGFVREAIRRATNPPLAFPDGSVVQHDWVRDRGFTRSSVSDAGKDDGFVRIAFLRPQDSQKRIGHVALVSAGRTLESHSRVGPNSRPWSGGDWQAKAYIYILGRTSNQAFGGEAAIAGDTAAAVRRFTVRSGRRYQATLALNFIESFADNETVKQMFEQLGFKDVTVTGAGSTRVAEGLWPGTDTTAELDRHIVSVVELGSIRASDHRAIFN